QALCRNRRDPAHGRPLGLCPAPLLALAAHRHGAGHGRHISRAAAPRFLRQRLAAGPGGLGRHGAGLPAGLALLPPLAALGPRAPGHRRALPLLPPRFRLAALARPRRLLEGPRPSPRRLGGVMSPTPEDAPQISPPPLRGRVRV